MATVTTRTFAVYSVEDSPPFEAFLLEVPAFEDDPLEKAARRAWWEAFHILGRQGVEPEQYQVCCWINNQPGPLVTSGGLL